MKVYQGVYEYIDANGGPESFDPVKEPDSYLELQQQILQYETGGNDQIAATYPPEELDELARFYLDLEPLSDLPVF